jgi:hypothetical protein
MSKTVKSRTDDPVNDFMNYSKRKTVNYGKSKMAEAKKQFQGKPIDSKTQEQITNIIKKRDEEIRHALKGKGKGPVPPFKLSKKDVDKSMNTFYTVVWVIFFLIGIVLMHSEMNLWKTDSIDQVYFLKILLFFIIYTGLVVLGNAQILKLSFTPGNTNKLLGSITCVVPVMLTFLILYFFPGLTSPFDNTLGYFIAKHTAKGDPMSKFKSSMFTENTLKALGDGVKIPFDWLLTTFNPTNKDEFKKALDSIPNKPVDIETAIASAGSGAITDFYIGIPERDGEDYSDFTKNLWSMIETKRSVGHLVTTVMACVAGLAMSIGISLNIK